MRRHGIVSDRESLGLSEQVRRVRAQLSYRVAAQRAGVSVCVLRRIERGQSVSTASLVRVLRWLDIWPKRRLWLRADVPGRYAA